MSKIEVMKKAAKQAGEFMLGAQHLTDSSQKANANDFVTVADIKSQNILREILKENFPEAVILSEEDSGADRQKVLDPNFTGFALDPIDGTYNFKRGMRESAISIGYIENGQSIVGVVYDTYKDELFEAEKGKGAFLNGQPIQVSGHQELAGASIATSNGYDYEAAVRNLQRQVAIYKETDIMPWTSCPGSAVLTLVWIACGRIDAVHHNGFKPWDNAAAFIIAQEAGAKITTLGGQKAQFTNEKLVIGEPIIVNQLLGIFSKLPTELLH